MIRRSDVSATTPAPVATAPTPATGQAGSNDAESDSSSSPSGASAEKLPDLVDALGASIEAPKYYSPDHLQQLTQDPSASEGASIDSIGERSTELTSLEKADMIENPLASYRTFFYRLSNMSLVLSLMASPD